MNPPFRTLVALTCLFSSLLSTNAAAQSFVNGSLTGTIANGGVPSGWTISSGTPDTMNQNNNVGVPNAVDFCVAPSGPSPDGGTWVGLGTTIPVERFGQVVSGFSIGSVYRITWYQGNFGIQVLCQIFGLGQNSIKVLVNSNVVGTGTTMAPGSGWLGQSVTFVATSGTMLIEFELANQQSSGYLSIDGIQLTEVAAGVPAMSTVAMTILAAFFVVGGVLVLRSR